MGEAASLRGGFGLLLLFGDELSFLQRQIHLLLRVVVVELADVGDQGLGQREVGDVIYSDQLPDPKAAKVLKGFDIAEPGDWIQELDRRWRKTWNPGSEKVEELPVFGVHDCSLYELHHRLAAVFKLGMAPQAEGPSIVLHPGVMGDALRPKAEAQDVTGVRTVSDQKGPIWLPLQLHLCILPVHRSPVPSTLLQLSQAGCKAAGVRAVERTLQVRGGLAGHRLHRPQRDNPWEGV